MLRNCGLINPDDIEEYIAVGGYQALYKVLIDANPEMVIEQIKAAKLRGRGGAGFLTGNQVGVPAQGRSPTQKYIICNADEGDPGAYMNRNEIESDPHALLEGMIIGGYVMGATEGIIYVRAEYPLAVHRLTRAIEQAREYGMLGDNILGRGFKFDIELVEGAGAFVCGEETALIASLEGYAGTAAAAPAVPGAEGAVGQAHQHQQRRDLVQHRAHRDQGAGLVQRDRQRQERRAPRCFRWSARCKNTGLVEMPLGTPLKTFIYDIGEGGIDGRHDQGRADRRAVGRMHSRTRCSTRRWTTRRLAQLGSIMGSGGMVVMDEDNCMVDVARYFIEFTHSESCGKCVPCRVGLEQVAAHPERVHRGRAARDRLDRLDELGRMIRDMLALRAGTDRAQSGADHDASLPPRVRGPHRRANAAARACATELALSPCENSCPLHMNIPRFLQLYKEGRLEEAFESVVLDNPLPASTGRVCQHPVRQPLPAADVGRRGQHARGAPLHRRLHLPVGPLRRAGRAHCRTQTASDRTARWRWSEPDPPDSTAAFYLALLGTRSRSTNPMPEPGGMLRFALARVSPAQARWSAARSS